MIKIGNQEFEVLIKRKNNKNMYLRVNEEGQLIITCPYHMPDTQIRLFIHDNEEAIVHLYEKMLEKKVSMQNQLNVKSVMILGKKYTCSIAEGKKNSCYLKGDQVVVVLKKMDEKTFESTLYQFLGEMMMKEINSLKGRWDRMLDDYRISYPIFQVKLLKSKWGSCTPARGLIVMNVRLMHYPIECLDAVLLHEYVHLIIPNHSKRFYQIIYNHMPEYPEIHKMLK